MRSAGTAIPFAFATIGIATFSIMDALMKGLSMALGVYNAMLWRIGAGLAIAGAVYLWKRPARPGRDAIRVHLIRGVVGTAMALLFFWGLARVPLAQGIALAFIAPIIALFLAAVMLGETIGRGAVAASLLGFAGVIVILLGQDQAALGPEAFEGAVAILISALLYGYNIILMRRQALIAGPVEIAFSQNLIVFAILVSAAPWLATPPPGEAWPAIGAAAALAFSSLLLLSWAYRRAEAQVLAPVEYTAFVWAAALGWLVFGDSVSWFTLGGAAMIVAGCLLAVRKRTAPVADVEAAL